MAEKGSKIGKLGGPLLDAASKAAGKVVERPSQAGEDAARELGERIQGRAAHTASRSRGVWGLLLQVAGGRLAPTRRGRAQMIERGKSWNDSENALAGGIARSEHDAGYREGGVAGGKAALVDQVGRGGRIAEQAVIQLVGSSSWVEFQGSVIGRRGHNQGKRVTETAAWQSSLSEPANSQLWVEVGKKRPDLTPDVQQGAERALGYSYDSVPGNRRGLLDDLDRLCLAEAMRRFDAGVLSGLHEGIFSEIARLGDPLLSQQLFDTLHNIANSPGTVGRDAIGSLLGPRAIAIDHALAPIRQSYSTI